ncbi:transglycosylase SLT domain-containing protein [Leuconostoc mesenteroides]|uniref:tape measure protein n=1 Tax=Leuconostoc mesenteroides TaxID=1245 RepID=UPI001CBB8B07|nr:tape measure protein [Leuconostoc mesenteroides]MBZ1515939.1 transglycosylase SLT domain-containing protein [Leuconostoc mesenteroides]
MAKQIVNEMATNLTLDSKSASQALKELTREVKNSSTEAKILESQYKASGDAVSASKAKYEGLQSTLEAQKTKIEALKNGLDNVNTSTKKGQDLQQYLNGELAKAERQYASYQGQLEKATQSYKYQESGLASLNDELKHSNSLTDARVQKLEAEGRTEEANKVKLEGLKNTQENYTKQLEIQKAELNKLAETGDKNTDSYKRQELRVEQMGAKLASTTSDIKHFNNTDIKPETKGLTSVKDKLNSLNDSLEGTRSHFKTIFMGNLIANGVTNALESIKEKLSETLHGAQEYNKEQQVMNATWTTLTDSASKGKEMVGSINQISTAFGQSNDVVNELSQQFYHVFNQKEPTEQLTKSMLTMADTLGMNSEGVERLGLNFTHMMSSTKLQLGDFNMITDQLPMYGEKLLEYEQKVQNNSKLTMAELRNQMSAGKISAKDATEVMNELGDKYKSASENMMGTASGMERVMSARGKALAGSLIQPIMNAQNPIFSVVSKWVSDPKTEQEFGKVGKSISKAFGTITSAFGKEFKGSDFTGGANKFMDNLAKSIEKFGGYVAKHKDDIISFFKAMKSLAGAGFGTLGVTLKIALPLLEQLGKFASKHPTTFKVLAGSILGLNLSLKGLLGTMKLITMLKGVKQTFKDFSSGLGSLKNGIKGIGTVMKANPFILIATTVIALGVSLTALYKHNKKFRDFVNGLVKGAQQFFKGIGKWFGQAYKTIMNFFKDILNFVKKDWKEILLFIVNPFAGAFALVYKHNAKFRKAVNNLVKDVVNFFKNMGKSIGDIFNSIFKNVSKIYNSIKDFIGDTTHNIYKGWVNSWKSIFNFFGDTWNNIKKFGSNSINSLKGTFDDVLGKIGKSFSNTWNGIKDGFRAMWDGMKQLAGDGINAVIRIPNAGIDGINGLIHDFGGSKNALGKIPRVKFANGTGAIQELTHAVLNDGNDSPETGNKETLIHPNGKMEIVQGQNIERLLLPGTEVLNARETAMFMGLQGVKHFAGGTGFWSKLLSGAGNAVSNIAGSAWAGLKNGVDKFTKMFSYITGAVADPSGTLGKVLNLKSGGVSSVMDGVAGGAYKKVTSTAKDWWSTLWSMASESSSSGTGSKGDDYAFKNKSKDSGVDPWGYFYRECVSFIASRLKNLGVSASLFSHLGNGADWVNAKVPHSKTPKVGDVAVYAAGSEFGNHASIVTGVQGDKISGEEYNWSGDGQYHTYNGRRASGATTFLDFGRSAGAKAKEVATNNPLSKLIKKQTGGMMEWIQKFIAPINDSSTGTDSDVQSWSGDVKKALSKLGLSTSGSMVSKVLKQIQTESGGNAKAKGGNDGLADGNATGLMQVKPGTFRAYALHGHNNIMNGYDNILAGLNYAKHRYGDSLSFLGHGHGYANGGLITKHQIAEIGEGNQPEMIIPLDGMKRSRGFELLGKTAVAMASRDGLTSSSATSDNSDVINQLKQAVELLTQLVQGQGNPVPVNVALDKNDWYKKQASDVNLRDYQSLA